MPETKPNNVLRLTLSTLVAVGCALAFAHTASAAELTRTLRGGSTGDDVRALQQLLTDYGYFPASVSPTGNFGSITEAAVKAFQKDKGITPLGIVGPITRAALNFLSRSSRLHI